jgi:hypothetical protein
MVSTANHLKESHCSVLLLKTTGVVCVEAHKGGCATGDARKAGDIPDVATAP